MTVRARARLTLAILAALYLLALVPNLASALDATLHLFLIR